MRELSEKAKLPVRTGLVAKSITSPDPGLIAFSITSPGGNEAARRRVMGSWSRGGGRRLYRGEVGCVIVRTEVGFVGTGEGSGEGAPASNIITS